MKKASIWVIVALLAIIGALLFVLFFGMNRTTDTSALPQNSPSPSESVHTGRSETVSLPMASETPAETTETTDFSVSIPSVPSIPTYTPEPSTVPVSPSETEPSESPVCIHTFGNWTVAKNATCTEAGSKVRKCTKCGEEERDILEATGHNYRSSVTKQSTCTSKGVESYTCTRCGHTYTKDIDPLGHNYSANTVEPTCTEGGYTTYTCTRCSHSYQGDTKSALGHSYSKGVCIRCEEIQEVNMLQRISAPDENESCFFIRKGNRWSYTPNHWCICWKARNLSGKTIKYVKFTIEYYNKVDDLVYKTTYKITGPIAPGEMIVSNSWDTGSMNFSLNYRGIESLSDLGKVAITEVQLQYSDDSVEKGSYSFSTSEVIEDPYQ